MGTTYFEERETYYLYKPGKIKIQGLMADKT